LYSVSGSQIGSQQGEQPQPTLPATGGVSCDVSERAHVGGQQGDALENRLARKGRMSHSDGGKAGVPALDLGKTILDRVQASVRKDIWLRHIVEVAPDGDGGWFAAPSIRITTATGEVVRLGIVKSTTALNKDPENRTVRDRAVLLIRQAVDKARAAAPPN